MTSKPTGQQAAITRRSWRSSKSGGGTINNKARREAGQQSWQKASNKVKAPAAASVADSAAAERERGRQA